MNTLKVIVLLIELSTVLSLECWDCKSSINAACSDPFYADPFAKMNCSANPKYEMLKKMYGNRTTQLCRKIIEKIDKEIRVIRTCGYLDDPNAASGKCTNRVGSGGLSVVSCHCSSDSCNASSSLTYSMVTNSFLVAVLILSSAFS